MSVRILELCLSPNLGGLELYMQRLTSFLHSKGDIHVALASNSRLDQALSKHNDLPILRLKKHAWKHLFHNAKQLARYIDRHEIDLIHMHWTKDLPLCVFAKKFSKREPKLVQSRHMNMTRFKSDFYHRYIYKNIDLMIAVTQQVKEQITHFVPAEICPPVKVSYIGAPSYNPLEESEQQKLKQQYQLEDSFIVTLAGRIEPAKGQALLISALEQLNNPKIKVMFIGDAMEEDYLADFKQNIDAKGLASQVAFTGFVNNVQDLMAISNCVVLATDKETFGMVLIEAMHAETTVIASNSGGPIEIIDHDKTGLLFSSGQVGDLAEKINRCVSNPDTSKRLAIAGKSKALNQFSAEQQFSEVHVLLTAIRQ